jgi:co-chaperonin GroES (HSP10)
MSETITIPKISLTPGSFLVLQDPVETETSAGVLVPEETATAVRQKKGTIVACGDGAPATDADLLEPQFSPGRRITWVYAGHSAVVLEGVEYLMFGFDDDIVFLDYEPAVFVTMLHPGDTTDDFPERNDGIVPVTPEEISQVAGS